MIANFFKRYLFIFFFFNNFLAHLAAQEHNNLYGFFAHDSLSGIQLAFLDNLVKLEKLAENDSPYFVGSDCLLEDTAFISNDTIYLHGEAYFKKMSNDAILSLQDIKHTVHKNDMFYCVKYYDVNKNLYLFSSKDGWKNGQKDGRWIYCDNAKLSGIIFKEGVIIDTFNIKMIDDGFNY